LFQVLATISLTGLIVGAAIWFRPEDLSQDSTETRVLAVLDRMLSRTRFAEFTFMPSYWLSRSVLQWAEGALVAASFFVLMLFSLLAVYIFNLRHFSQQLNNPFWTHLVSFLNLGACSLNLATLTTRFVYPQFSLEGKRLWVVGMAPLGLVKIVKTKYWLANALSLIVTLGL